MDSIANAVSDACEPQIVPDIEPYTINDKTIIVVTVLPEPEFIEMPESFRVNLFRQPFITDDWKNNTEIDDPKNMSVNVGENVGDVGEGVGDIKTGILKLISDNNKISASRISKKMSVAQRTVERYMKELREEKKLIRHGSARGGYWEVKM